MIEKRKILPILLSLFLVQSAVSAGIELDDVNSPKNIMYRLGTVDTPEVKYNFEIQPTVKPVIQKEIAFKDNQNITYADLSIN